MCSNVFEPDSVLWLSTCCWKLGLVWIWIVVRRVLLETTSWKLGLVCFRIIVRCVLLETWSFVDLDCFRFGLETPVSGMWLDACCWKLGLVWIWIVLDFDLKRL